ncbi:MAG: PDR/VanB family oxidoreductase [Solimonas sp.]
MSYDAAPAAQQLIAVRVVRRCAETQDVVLFELVAEDGAPLPPFRGGAHVDVHLPNGLVRQYSLCGAPQERDSYRIAVLREAGSRGGSRCLHEDIRLGAALRISRPRNLFGLAEGGGRVVLLAGGIGVTPLLAMAEELAAAGADFVLHYCTRSAERTAFLDHLQASAYAGRVRFHHSSVRRFDFAEALGMADDGDLACVCGPQGFIEQARDTAFALGWRDEQVRFERFSASAVTGTGDRDFEVELSSDGSVYRVPAGTTALAALAAQGVVITSSCEQGVCGSCLTPVLDGEPEHRDQFLSAAEQARNDRFLPCCSRAKSLRLVLGI